jgi:hypothetical protein
MFEVLKQALDDGKTVTITLGGSEYTVNSVEKKEYDAGNVKTGIRRTYVEFDTSNGTYIMGEIDREFFKIT